jgi:alpha-beta hydrolase superfamily lysophospholipase
MAKRAGIGRYENPYCVVEAHRPMPEGTRCEPLQLPTQDLAASEGWLWQRGGEDTVVCVMHPRANFARHYLVPALLEAGFAVLCQNSRWLGNDATLVHERLLLDVAEGVRVARQRFERVVLCGNSGGGSLYALYLHQVAAPEGGRFTDTAAGDPFDLNRFELPAADALILLAAHPGEGHFLLHAIDPSVSDERDPLSCDPSLDLFAAENGFVEPPRESRYTAGFLARYRTAQEARVARIDARAHAWVGRRRRARAAFREVPSTAARRASIATDFFVVHRTDADPRCVDLSIDPSERDYGSIWGRRPDWTNYGPVGFGRVVTPEAWLSTWSGLSSRAEITRTGPRITLPALVIGYAGDNSIFPEDQDRIAGALGSRDVVRVCVPGDHYGFPVETGREAAADAIVAWLRR